MKIYGIYEQGWDATMLLTPLYHNIEDAVKEAKIILEREIKSAKDMQKFCIEESDGHGIDMYPDWEQVGEYKWQAREDQSIEVSEIEVI